MKTFIFIIFLFYSNCLLISQETGGIVFEDNFKQYVNGSDGSPIWYPIKGNWQIINGAYTQKSEEYDCVSMLGIFISESFEAEISFEHLEGEPGVGFIFSSREKTNTDFAQMVRFDGNMVLISGYFEDGEFKGTASIKTSEIKENQKHSLTLHVDRENDCCTILLDKKELLQRIPIKFHAGYFGLQSSGGRVLFHHTVLKTLQEKDKSTDLDWIQHFGITPSHEFLIPGEGSGTIKLLNGNGQLTGKIGIPAKLKGQLHKPNSLALYSDSLLAVTDHGSNQLHLFTLNGKWLNSIGWKGSEPGQFDEPIAIAVNRLNQIFVLEKNNNRVQVFNDSLKPIIQFGAEKLKAPTDIAIQDSIIYILNAGLAQIEFYNWTGNRAKWNKSFSYGGGSGKGIAVWKDKIYASVGNKLQAYDTSGLLLHTMEGRSIDFISPQSVVIDNLGNPFFSDFFHGRIVQTTPDLLDPTPEVSYPDSTSAVIEWESILQEEDNKSASDSTLSRKAIKTNRQWSMTSFPIRNKKILDHLNPMTTYQFQFPPPLITIPERVSYPASRYTLTTPPGRELKLYRRLPIATLIFRSIIDDKKGNPDGTLPPPIPDIEINRIKNQIADGIIFYWIHSGMRLFLDNETFIINEPLKRSEVYGAQWWYPPVDSVIRKYIKLQGKSMENYSGFLYLTCTQEYDSTLKKYNLAGRGGGFTNGVGTGKGYGISWWDITKANHNAGNNWLMVHEFNHQLDDIFLASGYPEYWFNHISPTIGTAAKFGEHFDANSYIMHIVPKEEWYDLQFGSIETTHDADEDGIPDNDPKLPLDERRLGSDSTKTDTDGDGVADYNELFFSNWVTEGWGETYGSQRIFPGLNNKDSDGDGYDDSRDPYPCYPYLPEISYGTVKNQEIISFQDEKINAKIYSNWTEDSLYFRFVTDKPVPIKLMIDGNADGWFMGRENYLINIIPEESVKVKTKVQILNCTEPKKWPFMDQNLGNEVKINSSIIREKDECYLQLSIPANSSNGFNLKTQKEIGLSFGFLCKMDESGSKRYIDIFEPNRFVYYRLTSKEK